MSDGTALYRAFDRDGVLLYIGISDSFGRRWQQHAASQPWWPDVHRLTVDWYPDRESADAAETQAIQAEGPRYNVCKRSPVAPKPQKPHRRPARACAPPDDSAQYLNTSQVATFTNPPRHAPYCLA